MHFGHDPFARGKWHRENHVGKYLSCDWCGNKKKTLYSYTWEDDARGCPIPHFQSTKVFCNVECFRSYFT